MPSLSNQLLFNQESDTLAEISGMGTTNDLKIRIAVGYFLRAFVVDIETPFTYGYMGIFNKLGIAVFELNSTDLSSSRQYTFSQSYIITTAETFTLSTYSAGSGNFKVKAIGNRVYESDIKEITLPRTFNFAYNTTERLKSVKINARARLIQLKCSVSNAKPTWKVAGILKAYAYSIYSKQEYEVLRQVVYISRDLQAVKLANLEWISKLTFEPVAWIDNTTLEISIGI